MNFWDLGYAEDLSERSKIDQAIKDIMEKALCSFQLSKRGINSFQSVYRVK